MQIKSNGITIRVDPAPFVTGIVRSMARKGLLYKDDPLVEVDKLDEVLQDPSRLDIEPGAVLSCFIPLGGFSLKDTGLNLPSGKKKLAEILLSDDFGRAMFFNQAQLIEAVQNGIIETPCEDNISIPIMGFKVPGDTLVPQNKTQIRLKLRFLDGPIQAIPIVDNKGEIIDDPNQSVSLYAHYDPITKSSVLEITHIDGFDKTILLQLPVHVNDSGYSMWDIFYSKVMLPPYPEKLIEINVPIIGNEGTQIDLEASGLRIQDAEKKFFVRKKIPIGKKGIYEIKKRHRPINGFAFEVVEDGKKLTISPLPINHGTEDKTVFITAIDRRGEDVTVRFNICFKPNDVYECDLL